MFIDHFVPLMLNAGDPAIAGDDGIGVVAAGNGGQLDFATGGFDEELASGDVPEGNAGLDVGIQPAAGDVGHAERGGTHHAHLAGLERSAAEPLDTGLERGLVLAAADEKDGIG